MKLWFSGGSCRTPVSDSSDIRTLPRGRPLR
jgi:hypothetical protein